MFPVFRQRLFFVTASPAEAVPATVKSENVCWDSVDRYCWWLLIAGILVNSPGLFSPILEPDGALYATIAKHMVLSGDYVNLAFHGHDWLDKPHFQFWVTALSYHLFGITTFGYKFPAFLFWLAGLIYTYYFARVFYPARVAQLATLIYVSAFHLVLSNNDVRAEPYLTGLIIAALFHCYKGITGNNFRHILFGALFAAAAVMTKGIFVLIVIFPGLAIHWMVRREFPTAIFVRLTVVGLLTLLFTAPEIISLYLQFDNHPEKIVFGHQNVSGVRFFFWDSQFGRFFNTGPIKGEGDPFFFIHTILWAFFPWSIPFFASMIAGVRNAFSKTPETITLSCVLSTFLLFSLSKFQLPHYLNIVFPLMSILTAQFLVTTSMTYRRAWSNVILFTVFVNVAATVFLSQYSLPSVAWPVTIGIIVFVLIAFFFMRFTLSSFVMLGTTVSFIFYAFVNLCFVPVLMRYQAGSEAAFFWNSQDQHVPVVMLEEDSSCSFDFYAPGDVSHVSIAELVALPEKPFVFCHEKFVDSLNAVNLKTKLWKSFSFYKVSQPSGKFMNHSTRDRFTEHYVIVKIN